MPSIRELTATLRDRPGVQAVIVLGRDGLVIDSQAVPEVDVEGTAALVPSLLNAANILGQTGGRGELVTTVLEFDASPDLAILAVLSADALLLLIVNEHADVGQLLWELRQNREQIAALV
jgi:predicted regulator of Ras-like GTPase activity (Roadblock/LC7/MglB family)